MQVLFFGKNIRKIKKEKQIRSSDLVLYINDICCLFHFFSGWVFFERMICLFPLFSFCNQEFWMVSWNWVFELELPYFPILFVILQLFFSCFCFFYSIVFLCLLSIYHCFIFFCIWYLVRWWCSINLFLFAFFIIHSTFWFQNLSDFFCNSWS